MADLGHFAQFARTLLCGHFWSRRLRQKVARSLHFKRILMSREDHLRRAVFQAPKLGLLLSHFPLVPPLPNLRKWAIEVTLSNLLYFGFADSFLAAVCVKMLSDRNEQIRLLVPGRFLAPKFGLLLFQFPLVRSLQNLRKRAILTSCPICHNLALGSVLEPS